MASRFLSASAVSIIGMITMSSVSESKPWCAMTSAVKAVGIDSHPLTAVSPRFHIVLRRFSRTVLSLRADTLGPLYRTSVALVLRPAAPGCPPRRTRDESPDHHQHRRGGAGRPDRPGGGSSPVGE